ncbi:MAG: hypothetical protein ACRDI3_01315 [Actinomycetota bacterium]
MVVLVSALFGAAGAGILLLAPLVFDEAPTGLDRARPFVLASIGLAAGLLAAEWLGVH